jgi:hypothetical protein
MSTANCYKGSMNMSRYYDTYVLDVRKLCNTMYEHHGSGVTRRKAYHELGVLLIENILPELDSSNEQLPIPVEMDDLDLDQYMQGLTPDYELQAATYMDTDPMTDLFGDSMSIDFPDPSGSRYQGSHVSTSAATHPNQPNVSLSIPPSDTQPKTEQQPTAQPQQQPEATLADSCCVLCGYRPKGAPQWFKGSMAKHMKTKHSSKETYKCPFPGCTSQYTNRKDNLRQHQIEKGHFIDGEQPTIRRPSKRKKTAHDDDDESK